MAESEDLLSLLGMLCPAAIKLALRLNECLKYLEEHRSFATLRVEIKNGKAADIHVDQSFKEGDEIFPE